MKRSRSRHMAKISLVLAGILAFGDVLSASAADASAFGQLISGENTRAEEKPESEYIKISIRTEEDLANLAQNCQLDAWSRDKYVCLENDIVLEEHQDLSIPSFGGIFNGGGYEISGLNLLADGSVRGLFRYLQDKSVVRGLSVSGCE